MFFKRIAFVSTVLGIMISCGKEPPNKDASSRVSSSEISSVRRVVSGLDTLARAVPRSELRLRGEEKAKLEASLSHLERSLQFRGKFYVASELTRQLNVDQRKAVSNLINGLNQALADGTIKHIRQNRSNWTFSDGTKGYRNLVRQDRDDIRLPRIIETGARMENGILDLTEDPQFSSDFNLMHGGSGPAKVRWNWKWWGVRIGLTHKAAYYLCHYTSWVLQALPLPNWVESVIKKVACSFHSLDGDGVNLKITWFGAFWISDGY